MTSLRRISAMTAGVDLFQRGFDRKRGGNDGVEEQLTFQQMMY